MYETFYNLTDRPFQLTPDARFFYPSQGHRKALAFLRYGVQQGEGFVVITGDVGTGKTTLAQLLLGELKGQRIATASIVTTQLEDDELIRLVAASFGLPFQGVDKAALLKSLEGFFRDCVRQRKRVLLVVDEAQNLPSRSIEELRMLSNFQFQGKPLVQTFLLGQEQLRTRISSLEFEQLRQRITAVHHLGPLNVNETKEYIEHRLKCAGGQGDPTIINSAFLAIHEFTNGVPRRINTLCDRLFLFGFLEELHKIDDAGVAAVIEEIQAEYSGIDDPTASPAAPFEDEARASGGPGERPDPNQRSMGGSGATMNPAVVATLEASVNQLNKTLSKELGGIRTLLEQLVQATGTGAPEKSSSAGSPEALPADAQSLPDAADSPDDLDLNEAITKVRPIDVGRVSAVGDDSGQQSS